MESKIFTSQNYVHKGIIQTERIKTEKKYESKNFKYDFTFSPYTCKIKINF